MSVDPKNIFISSGAFEANTVSGVIDQALRAHCLNIELSSGLLLDLKPEDLISIKERLGLNVIFHNYFPRPENDFVLNIASNDEANRQRSISFIIDAINLARDLGVKFFSFHAGFCVDIPSSIIGDARAIKLAVNHTLKTIDNDKIERHLALMTNSLELITRHAQKCNVEIALENNNLEQSLLNYKTGNSPLLLAVSEEIIYYLSEVFNVGILLDVGHLKVSSATKGLAAMREFAELLPHASAFHVSDNNGLKDTNSAFGSNFEFLHAIREKNVRTVIEVYGQCGDDLKKMVNLLADSCVKN